MPLLRILLLTLILASQGLSGQTPNYTKTLSRLLIKNANNELLLIKVKEGFWVTPALYNVHGKDLQASLNALADSYGIRLTSPKLKGLFFLEVAFSNTSCIRLFFEAKIAEGTPKKTEDITDMKWVPIAEALELLDFEHITLSLEQIEKFPDTVWGGGFLFYKEQGILKSKQTQAFYPY